MVDLLYQLANNMKRTFSWTLSIFLIIYSQPNSITQFETNDEIIEKKKSELDEKLWELKLKIDLTVENLVKQSLNQKLLILESVQSMLSSIPDVFRCIYKLGLSEFCKCVASIKYNETEYVDYINKNSVIFKINCFGDLFRQQSVIINNILLLRNKIDRAVAYGGGLYTDKCDFLSNNELEHCLNENVKLFQNDYKQLKKEAYLKINSINIFKNNFSRNVHLCKPLYLYLHLSYLDVK
uniref:Uncharacterized protein n=2 Tax=Clastoptera arizonana TaxID=38151 RepID=A0A1B6BYE3_9HEMI